MSIAETFETVQDLLNNPDPPGGQQACLLYALYLAATELDAQGIPRPASAGATDPRKDLANLRAAEDAAAAVGESGNYLAGHDALVYTPVQACVTLHRYLRALGWTTTTAAVKVPVPDPSPQPSGQAGVQVFPDISHFQDGIDLAALKAAGYAGLIAKIGQGSSAAQSYGQTIDPNWAGWWPTAKALWGSYFMGYWYVGDTETPASQAARCKAAIGDLSIPVELDWETGGGSFTNLLAVLAAFRAAGLNVTSLYTYYAYGTANGAANIDTATAGLSLRLARYPNIASNTPAVMQAAVPATYWNAYAGGTIDAVQFASDCQVLAGWKIDCNVFKGSMDSLLAFFQGPAAPTAPVAPTAGQKPPVFWPAVWHAALDQSGLAGTHATMGTTGRVPATTPDGLVIDTSAFRLGTERRGKAYAVNLPAGVQRVECQPLLAQPASGATLWLGFSVMLGRGVPFEDTTFNVITRLRNNTDGGFPIGINVHDGQFWVEGNVGGSWKAAIGAARVLNWHDLLLRVTFSTSADASSIDAWVDGVQALDGYVPPLGLLTNGVSATWRYGLYRSTVNRGEATVWHMDWAAGLTMGSVLLPGSG